jgi:general secretion pathway protein G
LASILAVGGATIVVKVAIAQQLQNATNDRQAIQGTWRLLSETVSGKLQDYQNDNMQVLITDKQIQMFVRNHPLPPIPYTLDPSRKSIDNGSVGIYELAGDSLRFCLALGSTIPPTNMSEGTLPNRALWVMTRAAPTKQIAAIIPVSDLGSTTSPTTAQSPGDARAIVIARTDISSLETALDAFDIDTGHYPTGANGLAALSKAPPAVRDWRGPYFTAAPLDPVPLDPWNHPYRYMRPGIHNKTGFDLWSAGPDGIDGTDDDITNWSTQQ